jgi:hypothetical protein
MRPAISVQPSCHLPPTAGQHSRSGVTTQATACLALNLYPGSMLRLKHARHSGWSCRRQYAILTWQGGLPRRRRQIVRPPGRLVEVSHRNDCFSRRDELIAKRTNLHDQKPETSSSRIIAKNTISMSATRSPVEDLVAIEAPRRRSIWSVEIEAPRPTGYIYQHRRLLLCDDSFVEQLAAFEHR